MTIRPLVPQREWLCVKQVARRLEVCERTVWRWLAKGLLPQPIRYSRRVVRWRASDIDAFLRSAPALPGPRPGPP
jgi:predicted DNA-binding transcriptional regulator AlpA